MPKLARAHRARTPEAPSGLPSVSSSRRPQILLSAIAIAAALACSEAPVRGVTEVALAGTASAPPIRRHKPLGFLAAPVPPGSKEVLRLPRDRGLIVVGVAAGGLAERAGLRRGDVVLAIDGRPVASQTELDSALNAAASSGQAVAQVSRQGAILSIAIEL